MGKPWRGLPDAKNWKYERSLVGERGRNSCKSTIFNVAAPGEAAPYAQRLCEVSSVPLTARCQHMGDTLMPTHRLHFWFFSGSMTMLIKCRTHGARLPFVQMPDEQMRKPDRIDAGLAAGGRGPWHWFGGAHRSAGWPFAGLGAPAGFLPASLPAVPGQKMVRALLATTRRVFSGPFCSLKVSPFGAIRNPQGATTPACSNRLD